MNPGESVSEFDDLTPGAREALETLRERLGVAQLPQALRTLAHSEGAIKDLTNNFDRHFTDASWPRRGKLLVAIGVCAATGSSQALQLFEEACAAAGIPRIECIDAAGVALSVSAFNGYYRFRHQITAPLAQDFHQFRAVFHANALRKSSLTRTEIEAICISVSSINGCKDCVAAHIEKARGLGLTDEQIDEIVRVGAVTLPMAMAISAFSSAATPIEF